MFAFTTSFANLMQTWATTFESCQTNTLAFYQAVSTIQGQRARAITNWWQQAPTHFATMASNPTQAGDYAWRWYAQTCAATATLTCDITATRAHLVKVWQRSCQTSSPTPSSFTSTVPTSKPVSSSQTTSSPHFASPQFAGTFIPATTSQTTTTPETTRTFTPVRQPLPRIQIPQLVRVKAKVTSVTKATNIVKQAMEVAVQQPTSMEAQQPHEATNIVPFSSGHVASSTKKSYASSTGRASTLTRRGVGSRLTRGRAR